MIRLRTAVPLALASLALSACGKHEATENTSTSDTTLNEEVPVDGNEAGLNALDNAAGADTSAAVTGNAVGSNTTAP